MASKNLLNIASEDEVALSYHRMEKYFRVAVNINAVPYYYNKQTRRFHMDRKSFKYKLWFLLMMVGIVVETTQVTKELIKTTFDENVSRGEWALILFIFISWVFVTGVHYNVYLYGEDIVSYVNQVLGTREYFKESNLPPTNDHKVVQAHIYVSCGQCFFQALMVAAEGIKPQYLFSNVPEEYRNALAWAIWIPYAYYRVMSNFQAGYFQYFVGVLHVQTCNQILMYRHKTKESPEDSVKSYRMIQLLSKRYNFAFGYTFIPFISLMAFANIISGIYGTMRFTNELEMHLYMNFPLIVGMMGLFTFAFYPSNASLKELSDKESTRMLFSCLKMEDVLVRVKSAAEIVNERKLAEAEIIPKPIPALVDLVMKIPRAPTLIVNTREDEVVYDAEQASRLAEMVQKKLGRMLTKMHDYKMAWSISCSCPGVAVRLAGFYRIDRTTVLTIFDFIINNTVSALLTWP